MSVTRPAIVRSNSKSPCIAATINGVTPALSARSALAPESSSLRATIGSSRKTAVKSKERSFAPRALGSLRWRKERSINEVRCVSIARTNSTAEMGLGDWRSEASHAAASTKRAAKMPTETRFKFNERISGERPTDSIPLVKLRAAAIPMPGQPGGLAVFNVACSMLSNFEPMRLFSVSFLIVALNTMPILAATPELAPTPTIPAAAAEQGKEVSHQLDNAFAKVFETVAPSVVIIEISKKSDSETSAFEDLFFQGPPDENNPRRNQRSPQPSQSEGSGFIVRPDGYIFTNFHVVEAADKIDVKLKDGREFSAKVVGSDEKTDIAVIKIDAKDLPVVQLGDSDAVRVGQFAFAIGAPFKLDYTFTYGVVSGKGRSKLLATS